MGKMSDVLRRGGRGLDEQDLTPEEAPQAGPDKGAAPDAAKAAPAGRERRSVPLPEPVVPMEPGEGHSGLNRELLVSLFSPASPQGKQIDILRTQLLYPYRGDPPRTIMITSAAPGEGKSLLTANLAISFARGLQQFVLAIDCHLLDPSLHKLLQVPRQPGLTDYLEHGASVPDVLQWTSVEKLSLIPAGGPSKRSAEILAGEKMVSLINELRARYADRYILLDTPPVQAFDDPAVLARLVEGIVVVVMAGVTEREIVRRALGKLPEDKVIGIVLNDRLNSVSDAGRVSTALGEA